MLTDATKLLHLGLAPATRSNYVGPQRAYLRFAREHGVAQPVPASEDTLCMWVAWLNRSVQYATIRSYLYAVRSMHIELGLADPIERRLRLARVLTGVRRSKGDQRATTRMPITTELIAVIRELTDATDVDQLCMLAACSAATGGLMRVGEVAVIESEPARVLLRRDLQLGRGHFTIHLRISKTDQFGAGTRVIVSQQQAVSDMQRYLVARPHHAATSPLFMLSDGCAVQRRTLLLWARLKLERGGIDPRAHHRGLSFRSGGATSLADSGTPDHLIKELGRWRSWVYAGYIQTSTAALVTAAARM